MEDFKNTRAHAAACEDMLAHAGVKATPNRVLVLSALMQACHPLSLKELEAELETLDKSSIFRCLTLMREKDLLHCLEGHADGTRYEVCHAHHAHGGSCSHDGSMGHGIAPDTDEHVHFICERCGRTICLEDLPVPDVALPPAFLLHHREYTLRGLCPDCQ